MKKKIVSIVGARPQFIKASSVSRAVRLHFQEVLVHTGQHYDEAMSKVFFDELEIPRPDYDLGVGSGTHAAQTGLMLERIEKTLMDEKPDAVLVYGDTNSTLAGALAASKLCVPAGHVEAGLRSFNRAMPEEINRIAADRCSDWLYCPTRTAMENLEREGMAAAALLTGDVMLDAALHFERIAETRSRILKSLRLKPKGYLLCTVHRAENTDHPERLGRIVEALAALDGPVVFPVHPRTKKVLDATPLGETLRKARRVMLLPPVGYLDMVLLEKHASKILTDSGGIQKEAYFYGVPCITLREETEWVETAADGWNVIAGTDPDRILEAVRASAARPAQGHPFGDGNASRSIADAVLKNL
jgi:UDP-N-acetylglucosamine 2-epimerase